MRTPAGTAVLRRSRRVLLACGLASAALVAVAPAASADTLPSPCPLDSGTTNVRTCDLYAASGTIDLPGNTGVPTWLFSDRAPAPQRAWRQRVAERAAAGSRR